MESIYRSLQNSSLVTYYHFRSRVRDYNFSSWFWVWPTTDDYLVVLASYNRNFPQDELVTHFEYFSLRANTWKATDGTGFSYKQCYYYNDNQIGCFSNNALHWLAFRFDESLNVIVAFDLTKKVFWRSLCPFFWSSETLTLYFEGTWGIVLSMCCGAGPISRYGWWKNTMCSHLGPRLLSCLLKTLFMVGTSSQSALQQVVILSEKISELDWLNVVARDTCENIGLILMVNVDMKWPCIQSLYFHSLVIASRANKRKKMTNNSKLEELRVKSGCDLSVRRGVQW